MKTKTLLSLKGLNAAIILKLMSFPLIFIFSSCHWVDDAVDSSLYFRESGHESTHRGIPSDHPVLYSGRFIFICNNSKQVDENVNIEGVDLVNFTGCLQMKVRYISNRISRFNQPVVRIDGNQVVFPDDYNIRDSVITKEVCGKSDGFTLKVQFQGDPGSKLEVWFEGNMKNPVKDPRDGNIYPWVKIGNQIWMSKNLAYLPVVNHPSDSSKVNQRFYVYDYLEADVNGARATANYQTYGVLYNWAAAMAGADTSNTVPSGVQGACPPGWHLPSWKELIILYDYLKNNNYGYDGTVYTGKSLASQNLWKYSDTPGHIGNAPSGNNVTGFNGLPSGFVFYTDPYSYGLGETTHFWSSTEGIRGTNHIYYGNLWLRYNSSSNTLGYTSGIEGLSVRCIRNY
jgi:uncharacterized protein (TIGR02145 family)